jgi:carbon-monoxide dehydrogenase large subunit
MDPVVLRRRNLVRAFPHATPLGWSYDSGDYERCLDLALEMLDPQPGEHVGVALYVERAGGQFETARVERVGDRVIAHCGAGPHGQGHATTFAQIVADALDVDPETVEIRFDADGVGTFASRSTAMAGSALHLAAKSESGEARFESDLVFGSGAYAAAVEIDPDTGRLHVKRIAAVDDAGTIVNPLLAEGQVLGGAVHGLGVVLSEEIHHDADGQPSAASFAAYGLPTAGEIPEIRTAFVQSPSPRNPLGAKGIGEGGTIGVPAAIGNAVAAALGGCMVNPPYTPEKLYDVVARAPLS